LKARLQVASKQEKTEVPLTDTDRNRAHQQATAGQLEGFSYHRKGSLD
jgi:hypothetical protein